MTKDEALELAIKQFYAFDFVMKRSESTEKAIAAIKQALAAQPAPVQEPVRWSDYEPDGRRYPAVPDAFGTREGEHPQYIEGWNDCRAEMLKG
jgi:hypothetical protein